MGLLDGFEAMSLVPKKGNSLLTVSKSNIRFNKATAAELGFPQFVKLLVNARTNQIAIQNCSEKDPAAVPFCDGEKKQNYAIFIKIPALLAEFRRLLDFEEGISYSMGGITYPNDQVIIYDLKDAKKEASKWSGKKKKQGEDPKEEAEAEE